MQTLQATLLQSPAPAIAPPEVGMVEHFGILGVLGYLVLREGLGWWRSKEHAEDQLLATLVSDLRAANQNLIDKLFEMQGQQHRDQAELRSELRGLCDRIDKLL